MSSLLNALYHVTVMRTALDTVSGSFSRQLFLLRTHCVRRGQSVRDLSTNSAINRGIRRGKSNNLRGNADYQNKDGGREGGQSQKRTPSERHGGARPGDPPQARAPSERWEGQTRARPPSERLERDGVRGKTQARIASGRHEGDSRRGEAQARTPSDRHKNERLSRSEEQVHYEAKELPKHHWMGRGSKRDARNSATWKRGRDSGPSGQPHKRLEINDHKFGFKEEMPSLSWDSKPSSTSIDSPVDGVSPTRDYTFQRSASAHRARQLTTPRPIDTGEPENSSQSIAKRYPKEPLSIPYTTPASEFLYGTSVVLAALKTRRRKMYKLYAIEGGDQGGKMAHEPTTSKLASVQASAVAAGVPIEAVKSGWLRLMDKMSNGRPHNVCY